MTGLGNEGRQHAMALERTNLKRGTGDDFIFGSRDNPRDGLMAVREHDFVAGLNLFDQFSQPSSEFVDFRRLYHG